MFILSCFETMDDPTNMQNIELSCRICLSSNGSEDIFDGEPPQVLTKLLACTSIKITESDGLPRFLCFSCLLRLNDAYNLKCQCESNDVLLQKMLLQRSMFSDEEKEHDFDVETSHSEDISYSVIKEDIDVCSEVKEDFDVCSKVKEDFDDVEQLEIKSQNMCKENKKPKAKEKCKIDPLFCSYCFKEFKRKDALARHVLIHMDDGIYPCNVCNKRFKRKEALNKHGHRHDERCYVCDICGKTFKDSYYITKHKRNVHSETKFKCNICNKMLKTKNSLKIHMLIHDEVKKYVCTHCGQKFTHMQSLKGHLRTHTGGKPYSCKYCDSKFSTLKSKIEHERLHTGHRPYQCPICSKAFAQKSNMKSHFVHNHKSDKWELHNPKSLRRDS